MGNLSTLYPELSPMLWTSIATGKRPFKHGIHGFTEPDPDGQGVRPVTNLSRTTKALWNILSQNDIKCNVIGWWPSHPAEPINGVMVSNHYQRIAGKIDEPWPVMRGAVHPVRITDNLARLRVHPAPVHVRPGVLRIERDRPREVLAGQHDLQAIETRRLAQELHRLRVDETADLPHEHRRERVQPRLLRHGQVRVRARRPRLVIQRTASPGTRLLFSHVVPPVLQTVAIVQLRLGQLEEVGLERAQDGVRVAMPQDGQEQVGARRLRAGHVEKVLVQAQLAPFLVLDERFGGAGIEQWRGAPVDAGLRQDGIVLVAARHSRFPGDVLPLPVDQDS